MAFTVANLYNQNSMPPGFGKYIYKSDTDTRATVMASGYFNNTDDLQNFAADDIIVVVGDEGGYTLRVDTVTAGVVTTDLGSMSGPIWLTAELTDVSTASSTWLAAPCDGIISRIKTILHGAIITADALVGIELAGVDVTGGQVTIATASSAAGDVDISAATALNTVAEGDAIEIDTNGASGNTISVTVMVEILPV